jgi:recombination protein RecR
MYPEPIQRLIELFSKFPTIGQRTASRFVFYLLRKSKEDIKKLLEGITELKEKIQMCAFCFNPFDSTVEQGKTMCAICQNPGRANGLLCVVEKESDLEALEKTQQYNGLYFILGGTVGTLKKADRESIRLKELKERVEKPQSFGLPSSFKEVIIALNPTTEGEATALYLERTLKDLKVKLTRLGRGLPIGGELEYADAETLKQSLENRR